VTIQYFAFSGSDSQLGTIEYWPGSMGKTHRVHEYCRPIISGLDWSMGN
jgi:hypothetical protein